MRILLTEEEKLKRQRDRHRSRRQQLKLIPGEDWNQCAHLEVNDMAWVAAMLDISDNRAWELYRRAMHKLRRRFKLEIDREANF